MSSIYQSLIRPILFRFNPENAHNLTIRALNLADSIRIPNYLLKLACRTKNPQVVGLWDLQFPNKVGLAAGMDKDGLAIASMFAMGFGFVEVGTVTPKPQSGNPKPRLFRFPETGAVVNRMGFNNDGVHAVKARIERFRKRYPHHTGIIGVNIGKQKETSIEQASEDYLFCFEAVADVADYIAVNVSSPNTQNLRELQQHELLEGLLLSLSQANMKRIAEGKRQVPLLLKIAPDLEPEGREVVVNQLIKHQWDGIIATNTTIDRSGDWAHYPTPGGLSGRPLRQKSTDVIRHLSTLTEGKIPIIGVGGIETAEDANEKLDAGACLVQVYSGFIYEGPLMVKRILCAMQPPSSV